MSTYTDPAFIKKVLRKGAEPEVYSRILDDLWFQDSNLVIKFLDASVKSKALLKQFNKDPCLYFLEMQNSSFYYLDRVPCCNLLSTNSPSYHKESVFKVVFYHYRLYTTNRYYGSVVQFLFSPEDIVRKILELIWSCDSLKDVIPQIIEISAPTPEWPIIRTALEYNHFYVPNSLELINLIK